MAAGGSAIISAMEEEKQQLTLIVALDPVTERLHFEHDPCGGTVNYEQRKVAQKWYLECERCGRRGVVSSDGGTELLWATARDGQERLVPLVDISDPQAKKHLRVRVTKN